MQISFAVTAKLISAFVFATRKVQFLFFLNPKFQASSCLLCFYSLVCVRPVWKPHCLFSHKAAEMYTYLVLMNQQFYSYTIACLNGNIYDFYQVSHLMGKPTICIGENKDADQLRGNREADQRLCFRYSDSTIPLLLKSEISSL